MADSTATKNALPRAFRGFRSFESNLRVELIRNKELAGLRIWPTRTLSASGIRNRL